MNLEGKSGLLIDDIAEMRSALRIQLADIGLEKCDAARNIKEAVERLSENRYDLIVCDFNLGQGADGQQFLELVRRKKLLPLSTAFLMVTAETGYEQVSTAAEYVPDDYLLKPFKAEMLSQRLERIFAKKAALNPIYRWLGEKGDHDKALSACDALIAAGGRYVLDAQRLKGELLLAAKRPAEARALYESVLAQRSTPWAAVGQAQALLAEGNLAEARHNFEQALVAYPSYLVAYDSLAELLAKTDKAAAQQVVEQALKVAPSTQRTRDLADLAIENKDYARAETALKRVVDKDRTGFFKRQEDYTGLAKSRIEQGKTDEALAALKDMGSAFSRTPELMARQSAVEAQVHSRAGNTDAAKAALDKALGLQRSAKLDVSAALEVAQACFSAGRPDEAKGIIQAVAEDHHENEAVMTQAQAVFAAAGLEGEGTVFLEDTRKRMIKLNNDAVALAKSGQLDQAVAMLTEAADRLTNNAQIAINAALALLMHAHRNGADAQRIGLAHRYILQARQANDAHPRLAEVSAFYKKIAPDGSPLLED